MGGGLFADKTCGHPLKQYNVFIYFSKLFMVVGLSLPAGGNALHTPMWPPLVNDFVDPLGD